MVGRTLSHYKILEEIGRGGMGIVYRALDIKLNREVALKTLPPDLVSDKERKRRFIQEARAAAALKHPNIGVIYEIDEVEGVNFIAMELIEGVKLTDLLRHGPLPTHRAVELATEVAEGLACAHEKGIVHRDLKPANLMVTHDGHAKIIDFGLAKLLEPVAAAESAVETAIQGETRSRAVLGTVSYMAPEQALGQAVDTRSDLFSFGATLYEMVTGTIPFKGETPAAVFDAILHKTPISPKSLNPELPESLEGIITKLLEKDPQRRFQSPHYLIEALRGLLQSERQAEKSTVVPRWLRRPQTGIPIAGLMVVLLVVLTQTFRHRAQVRWAKQTAILEISNLIAEENYLGAYQLAEEAEKYIPEDPLLTDLWPQVSRKLTAETVPEGADVYWKNYREIEGDWELIGKTPLEDVRIPQGYFRWRIEKTGFRVVEVADPNWRSSGDAILRHTLAKEDALPPGMVRVEPRKYTPDFAGLEHLERAQLDAYWIDKYEVTNRQFKEFVDSGGYRNKQFWTQEFVKEGRALTWEEAMKEFVDATGQPGPLMWELGSYPEGRDDYPVTGVSWYEAAAFAEFAGKRIPTIYHWGRAAGTWMGEHLAPLSNYESDGARSVGSTQGLSLAGAYDMAGNVKEWCWNRSRATRYILGGAWNEPDYTFTEPDAQDPFQRQPTYGFRCIKLLSEARLTDVIAGSMVPYTRNFTDIEPISDEVFQIYKRFFSYDKTELNPTLESTDETAKHWTMEKVSFDAAYGGERIALFLFLPKNTPPPYQTVVYFPGSSVINRRSSDGILGPPGGGLGGLDFLLKSGRAVIFPVYKGTYERGSALSSDFPNTTTSYRDHVFMWAKDLGRSIDYLETRSEFSDEIAFYGISWGAALGALLPAIEERLKVGILVSGGFYMQEALPEADYVTYAPRVTIPTLMLSGRYDGIAPVRKMQIPMFEALGTPDPDKRHVLFDSGHMIPRNPGIKEILNWLDTYLGPVS